MGKEWILAEKEVQGEWALPGGWVWTTIGEITQPIEKVRPRNNPDEHFTYLDISSINNRSNRVVEPKAYYGAEAPSRARQLVRANDVLFSTVRTYLRNIALVPEAYDGQIASTGFSILRGEPGVSPKYLFYYALTDRFLSELGKLQRGTSYPAVRDGDVRAQPIPLASPPEQRRIVAEIETQFTRLDAAVVGLERAQANLRRYKAAVLKAACEGRLVPTEAELARVEGRHYEPADQLLARILAERRTHWEAEHPGKGYKEPAPPDTEDLPELPEGWAWAVWEQLCERVTVGHVGPMKKEYVESGIPFLRSQNVRENRFDPRGLRYISPAFHAKLAKSALHPGDVVVVRSGSVGVTCVIPENLPEANCSDLVIIRSPIEILPDYGSYYMNSRAKSYVKAGQVGVALTHFNTKSVAALPVALPPLAEQRRIVAEVDRRLSLVAALEVSVEAALARAGRLRQAVLKQAFEGRLVPQDPNDELASVLLERIRAQRKADERAGKTGRKKRQPQQLELL